MKQSDYGRGLIVNLIKFAEHLEDDRAQKIRNIWFWHNKLKEDDDDLKHYDIHLQRDVELFKKIELVVHKNFKKAFSSVVHMWIYGASDHLYDIEVPSRIGTKLGKKIILLRHFGLELGHGKGLMGNRLCTIKDYERIVKMVKEIALLIDKDIFKLKADWGKW
jgi:hypothetical protein